MSRLSAKTLRRCVHLFAPLPLLWLAGQWVAIVLLGHAPREMGMTSDPVAYSINYLGLWTFRLLLLTLAITPLRRLTGRAEWMATRRPLGLWAFAYAGIHLFVYFGLNLLFSVPDLLEDVARHPFVLFGMGGLLLLLPLAFTSTQRSMKRLGKNWRRLHWLVYPAALLVATHFIYRVKGFQIEPWIYAGLVVLLLAVRLIPPQRLRAGKA